MSLKEKAREVLKIIEDRGYLNVKNEWIDLEESIEHSFNDTITYKPDEFPDLDRVDNGRLSQASIEVTEETTQIATSRMIDEGCEDIVLLNFASARNPGGGFLNGAKAQEEDLSRCSTLHSSLFTQTEYYEKNREQKSMLYTDHAIYSPGIAWFRTRSRDLPDKLFHASVITSPAPNANQALRKGEDEFLIEETLIRRSGQILHIAREHKHRNLVLGAWGCGVFGNDPQMVAEAFKKWLDTEFANNFDRVVFAVYDRTKIKNVNRAFKDTFHNK